MDETYEGWTNRQTWLVNLWINNERETHFYWKEQTAEILENPKGLDAIGRLADALQAWSKDQEPNLGATFLADLLSAAFGRVDWHEIAQSMIADARESNPFWPGDLRLHAPAATCRWRARRCRQARR